MLLKHALGLNQLEFSLRDNYLLRYPAGIKAEREVQGDRDIRVSQKPLVVQRNESEVIHWGP